MKIDISKCIPMHDRVLVEVGEPDDVSPCGIILPPSAREMHNIGTVRAVGQGRPHMELDVKRGEKYTYLPSGKFMPMGVKPGDKVLIGKYAGAGEEQKIDGKVYRVIFETAIIAVLGK